VLGSNNTNNTASTANNTVTAQPPQIPHHKPLQPLASHQQPIKKSIGIQHPPHLCDQSIQTSTIVCMLVTTGDKPNHLLNKNDLIRCAKLAVKQVASNQHNHHPKRSHSLFNTCHSKKSSLPDLTFLNEYSTSHGAATNNNNNNTIVNTNQQQHATAGLNNKNLLFQGPVQVNTSSVAGGGSELLKRKTLKSIKRYRQTKQNTEPCGMLTQPLQIPLQQQYFAPPQQNFTNTNITSPEIIKKYVVLN
jgi:hypothetical protein